jgi:predicted RNA-binding Zn-ribbon protein involved in translation (DUF1610 family)
MADLLMEADEGPDGHAVIILPQLSVTPVQACIELLYDALADDEADQVVGMLGVSRDTLAVLEAFGSRDIVRVAMENLVQEDCEDDLNQGILVGWPEEPPNLSGGTSVEPLDLWDPVATKRRRDRRRKTKADVQFEDDELKRLKVKTFKRKELFPMAILSKKKHAAALAKAGGPASKVCQHCGKQFSDDMNFLRHLQMHRMESWKCSCKLKFDSFIAKKRHIRLIHMKGFVQCPTCLTVLVRKCMLRHIRLEHQLVACEACGFEAKGQSALDMHLADQHPYLLSDKTAKKKMVSGRCDICGRDFGDAKKAYNHKQQAHLPAKCKQCGQVFPYLRDLKKHRFEVHMVRPTFNCDSCDRTFTRRNLLTVHVKRVHLGEQGKHQCTYCQKRFFDKHKLDGHVVMAHTRTQPHACRYGCGKHFNCTSNRIKHEKAHHGESYGLRQKKLLANNM